MHGTKFNGTDCKIFHNNTGGGDNRGNTKPPETRIKGKENQPTSALPTTTSSKQEHPGQRQQHQDKRDILTKELRDAIRHMVANISKSFIVDWYTSISPTNHDFVASCESLIEEVLLKLAELCITKLDKYKIGQSVTTLLHNHILNEASTERRQSIDQQIDNYEYDICQSSTVRLFGLLSNDNLRRVVFTLIDDTIAKQSNDLNSRKNSYNDRHKRYQQQQYQHDDHQRFSTRTQNGYPKSFSFDDIISSASRFSSPPSTSSSTATSSSSSAATHSMPSSQQKTTSALYTLVIAMLTKAAFMPIINNISDPKWLYAVIIWLCKKEERDKMMRDNIQSEKLHPDTVMCSDQGDSNRQFPPRGLKDLAGNVSNVVDDTKSYRTLDLEEGLDIASANINFENPICDSLKRPLDNIEIFATEEVKSRHSCYILYCIRYDGLYYKHPSASFKFVPEYSDVPIIDKRQTHSVRRRNESSHRCDNLGMSDESSRKSFRRSMTIKRRFREFVLLQLRLEENPKIRPYMKNIPKPTKLKAATQNIFSLPGINNIKLDQSTIKLRQRFLERFLVALNNSPFISNSYEFKEFFSYNVNPSGMSKSKSTILQVNLNKVFVDSLRSAFSIIRSTLPGDDHHQSLNTSSKLDPDAWLTELQQSTLKLHVQTRTSHSKMNLERYIDSKLLSLSDSPTKSMKSLTLGQNNQRGAFDWMGGSRGGSLRAGMANSNSLSSNTNLSSVGVSRSSSSYSNQQHSNLQSEASSSESVYHDASGGLELIDGQKSNTETRQVDRSNDCNSIQICDNFPIASKFIDIIHYSISRNSECSKSPISLAARFFIGRLLERYAIQMIDAALTIDNAAFSINNITSSIWDESDDPPLDMENASLDEAVAHLTRLIEQNYASHTLVPRQLLNALISNQTRFYLSQLESQTRNKFVIYSFFVNLLDELENC